MLCVSNACAVYACSSSSNVCRCSDNPLCYWSAASLPGCCAERTGFCVCRVSLGGSSSSRYIFAQKTPPIGLMKPLFLVVGRFACSIACSICLRTRNTAFEGPLASFSQHCFDTSIVREYSKPYRGSDVFFFFLFFFLPPFSLLLCNWVSTAPLVFSRVVFRQRGKCCMLFGMPSQTSSATFFRGACAEKKGKKKVERSQHQGRIPTCVHHCPAMHGRFRPRTHKPTRPFQRVGVAYLPVRSSGLECMC